MFTGTSPRSLAQLCSLLPVAALLAAVLSGCGSGAVGSGCRTNADCNPGLFCDPVSETCQNVGGPGTDAAPGTDALTGTDADPGTDALPGTDAGPGTDALPGTDAGPGTDALPGTDAAPGTDAMPPCTPGSCDDGNPCTDDTCDPSNGCVFTPDDTNPCSDGSVCTAGDSCNAGACIPGGAMMFCSDFNPCTDDSCDPIMGCVYVNDDTNACDDGDACTGGDACVGGICTPNTILACNDFNDCTSDSCDTSTGCVYLPTPGTGCDDGDACTINDTCDAMGGCGGATLVCFDDDPCTDDMCVAGGCPFPPLDCDDMDPGTLDLCDATVGCENIDICFDDDFDSPVGITPWTFMGDWQLVIMPDNMSNAAMCVNSPPDHLPAFSGTTVLWMGDTATDNYSGSLMCGYTSAASGMAISPPFMVPAGAAPELIAMQWFEIECFAPASFDRMRGLISVNGGPFVVFATNNGGLQSCTSTGNGDALSNAGASYVGGVPSTPNVEAAWARTRVSTGVTMAVDSMVQIAFDFNSMDTFQNSFRGWALDNIMVICP